MLNVASKLFIPVIVVLCVVAAAVMAWFYLYQDELKKFRLTVRAMLALFAAVAVGVQVGLLIIFAVRG
jgi:hypothetical protein